MNRAIRIVRPFLVGLFLAATAFPATAEWRSEVPVLRIGVMTGENPDYRLEQLVPFRRFLESRLSIPVEISAYPDFPRLIDAQAAGLVDYAVESATAYVVASARCDCVEPLVVPVRDGGESGFHALLVSRRGSGIRSLGDVRGKTLAVAAADSVAGRRLQWQALEAGGIDPEKDLAAIVEKPDPAAALAALLEGEADVAVAWSSLEGERQSGYSFGVLRDLAADGRLSMETIELVWQSPLIPFGPHVVRAALPEDLKSLLRQSTLSMPADDPQAFDAIERTGGQGLARADRAMFAPLLELIGE